MLLEKEVIMITLLITKKNSLINTISLSASLHNSINNVEVDLSNHTVHPFQTILKNLHVSWKCPFPTANLNPTHNSLGGGFRSDTFVRYGQNSSRFAFGSQLTRVEMMVETSQSFRLEVQLARGQVERNRSRRSISRSGSGNIWNVCLEFGSLEKLESSPEA